MRSKEEAHDYRYFPDPDLPPLVLSDEFIKLIKDELPELPEVKLNRFVSDYGLDVQTATKLTLTRPTADYFERVVAEEVDPKLAANWINGELASQLNNNNLDINDSKVKPKAFAELLQRIADGTVSGKIAKTVFDAMWRAEGSADEIIDKEGLKQITDGGELESLIAGVIDAHPEQVAQFKGGNEKVFGFFVGQVMKISGGRANPKQVNEILRDKLAKT
jgi:aspartyl-tRNA(Asn)/glutamyl-tRNA(Gln) amidotransferase subunit B